MLYRFYFHNNVPFYVKFLNVSVHSKGTKPTWITYISTTLLISDRSVVVDNEPIKMFFRPSLSIACFNYLERININVKLFAHSIAEQEN